MKIKLVLGLLLVTSVSIFGQDKKWSVEANYPISIAGDLGNNNPGIVDLGVKYRFLDLKVARIGAGFNAGVFRDRIQNNGLSEDPALIVDFTETNWLLQPKVFSEFQIPGIPKLRPSLGLGYTVIVSNFDGKTVGQSLDSSNTDGGFNLNLGLSYDITDKLFIQGQYDFISYAPELGPGDDLGFVKFGLGFRF